MAWEWLDDLQDLSGDPGSSSGSNTTWNKALKTLNQNESFYQLSDNGDLGTDGSWNKFYDGYSNHQIATFSTSWGLTIQYNTANNLGGVDVSWYENDINYGQGFGSLYGKYGIRFAVNHSTQKAVLIILWRFANPGWYTVIHNGGAYSSDENKQSLYRMLMTGVIVPEVIANGGGATHIAKVTGLLSTLSSNLSDILIVSGGGGGGLVASGTAYNGADAGGVSGSGELSGDQSTGYRFGQGESNLLLSGGGSGLYGGYKSNLSSGAGAGSGYIGNELLINKKMVGHNVPTSDNEDDLTESVNTYSENHDESLPQLGNGYARISYLGKYCPGSQWRFATRAGHRLSFTCSEIYIDSYWEDIRKICENSDDYPYFYNLKKEVKAYFSNSYTLNSGYYARALFGGGGGGALGESGSLRYRYKPDPEPRQLIFTKRVSNGYSKTYEIDMQYDDNGNLASSFALFGGYNHTTQKGLIVIIEYNSCDNTYRFIDDEVPEPNENDYIILMTSQEWEPAEMF